MHTTISQIKIANPLCLVLHRSLFFFASLLSKLVVQKGLTAYPIHERYFVNYHIF